MIKFVSVCALSLALLGFASMGTASSAAPGQDMSMRNDHARQARLERVAAMAEARVNRSQAEKNALGEAVRSKNNEQVRSILMRNGMTAEDLRGVDLRYADNGAPTHHGERLSIKRITIEGGCCPPWIRITIYF